MPQDLNKLNQEFYQKISKSFSATRKYSWDGWEDLFNYFQNSQEKSLKDLKSSIENKELKVLDIACGNSRLATFFQEKKVLKNYVGIDSNKELLEDGQKRLQEIQNENPNFEYNLIKKDLLEEDFINPKGNAHVSRFQNQNSELNNLNLITIFGFIHHIPAEKQAYFWEILKELSQTAPIIITTWRFTKAERILKKAKKLETAGDYLLGWKEEENTFRFAHDYEEKEILELSKKFGIKAKYIFSSDGKEGNLNDYYLLT